MTTCFIEVKIRVMFLEKLVGASGWRVVEEESENNKVPTKILRYFPLKPRIQRMYICKEFSKLMTWHAVEQKKDAKLWHPTNGEAWKVMDDKYL